MKASEWQDYARAQGIHPVDVNIFLAENDVCPTCGGKFGEFPEGESAIPHFLGKCRGETHG